LQPDQKPGDVILILTVEDHDTITLDKKNNNLFSEVTLTLSEALLGFDRLLLTHLDGRGIRVNQPAPGQPGYKVFSTGDVVKVEGEGFPKRKSPVRGDLFLKVTVTMPTKEEMEALASKHLAVSLERLGTYTLADFACATVPHESPASQTSRCHKPCNDR
jgi:DnaJ family protein A protein 2